MINIIATTGTKGKTTVTGIIADVLRHYNERVLKVDTKGHYVNGELKSSLEDSKLIYGLVPTVAPGRYLYELADFPEGVAVLETALGSSSVSGLAYRNHKVGIFLNVLEDHLGSSSRLKTRRDIMLAKKFIFERLDLRAYAVFNADDALVCEALQYIPEGISETLVPFGLKFDHFDLSTHLNKGGVALSVKDDMVLLLEGKNTTPLMAVGDVAWTFEGKFVPSVYNLLAIIGGLYGYFNGELPSDLTDIIAASRLDPTDGRLTMLHAKNGVKILADYAHEKYSLKAVGQLAKSLTSPGGKAIGVVRLAYDRTDEIIADTGKYIANDFDQFIVYDKIDGHFRKARKELRGRIFTEEVGKISKLFADALTANGGQVERILREDEAYMRAAAMAKPGDVVVCIVNDDIVQSLDFIKKAFDAKVV